MLTSKRKALKQMGHGNKKNRADPFTEAEISILFQKKLLGPGKTLEILENIRTILMVARCQCTRDVFFLLVLNRFR